jgi:hypothetical protein
VRSSSSFKKSGHLLKVYGRLLNIKYKVVFHFQQMEVVFHLPKRVAGWQSELCIQCIGFYALYSMHCILCIVSYVLYSMHCIICIVFYALYSMHCILCIVFYALYSMHCILCIVLYELYSMHCILCIHKTIERVGAHNIV